MFYKNRDINKLKRFIESRYDIIVESITPAKRGSMAETYAIETEHNKFFAKLVSYKSHQDIYRKSFEVIEYLNNSNIDFIIKNIRTKDNETTSEFENGTLGLFKYVEGEHTEVYPLDKLFEKYARIYKVGITGINIKREDFKASNIGLYEDHLEVIRKKQEKPVISEIVQYFNSKEKLIDSYKQQLRCLGERCRNNLDDFYITHGDGGGNVIVNGNDITIIDWDTPLLAPIERDVWVFLSDQDALIEFKEIIARNNINYVLKEERLCYYCYSYLFYYLGEILEMIDNLEEEIHIRNEFQNIQDLFSVSNWMHKNMTVAQMMLKTIF